MWWSERRAVRIRRRGRAEAAAGRRESAGRSGATPARRTVILAVAAAAGCGFRPLHREEDDRTGSLSIREAETPEDHAFRERLRRRLGSATGLSGRIDFALRFDEAGVAITPEANVTRRRVSAAADWRFEPADVGPTLEGKAASVGGYDAAGEAFPARSAARDERRRLSEDLAERVALRLLAARDRL